MPATKQDTRKERGGPCGYCQHRECWNDKASGEVVYVPNETDLDVSSVAMPSRFRPVYFDGCPKCEEKGADCYRHEPSESSSSMWTMHDCNGNSVLLMDKRSGKTSVGPAMCRAWDCKTCAPYWLRNGLARLDWCFTNDGGAFYSKVKLEDVDDAGSIRNNRLSPRARRHGSKLLTVLTLGPTLHALSSEPLPGNADPKSSIPLPSPDAALSVARQVLKVGSLITRAGDREAGIPGARAITTNKVRACEEHDGALCCPSDTSYQLPTPYHSRGETKYKRLLHAQNPSVEEVQHRLRKAVHQMEQEGRKLTPEKVEALAEEITEQVFGNKDARADEMPEFTRIERGPTCELRQDYPAPLRVNSGKRTKEPIA